MIVLVIGRAGYYGSCLQYYLAMHGTEVSVLDASKQWDFHRKAVKTILSLKPDVVHIQFFEGAFWGLGPMIGVGIIPVYRFCLEHGIPVVTTFHEVPHPLRLEVLFRKSPFPLNRLKPYRKLKARIRKSVYAWIIKHSSAVIVHTREHKRLLTSWGFPHVFWIPHGTRILPDVKGPRLSDKFTLLSFGAIRTDKRYDLAFKAIRNLDIHYVIHMSPPQESISRKWKENIRKIKPENVTIIDGYLPLWKLLELIASSDAVLFPYDKIGMGASSGFHHAIGLGKPVIAPEIGEFKDWKDYIITYTYNDWRDLQRAIIKMISQSEYYAKKSIELAKLTNWRKIALMHHKLYKVVTWKE